MIPNPNSLIGIAVAALSNKRLGPDNPVLQHARGAQQLLDTINANIAEAQARKESIQSNIAQLERRLAACDVQIVTLEGVRHHMTEVTIIGLDDSADGDVGPHVGRGHLEND